MKACKVMHQPATPTNAIDLATHCCDPIHYFGIDDAHASQTDQVDLHSYTYQVVFATLLLQNCSVPVITVAIFCVIALIKTIKLTEATLGTRCVVAASSSCTSCLSCSSTFVTQGVKCVPQTSRLCTLQPHDTPVIKT